MNQAVCPQVKEELQKLNFILEKETPNSPDSDLVLSYETEDEHNVEDLAKKISKACRGDLQQITVSVKQNKLWA